MKKSYKNICSRCGKERIVVRVWKEKVEGSVIENTETACPDKACQKASDQDNKKQKQKRLQLEARKRESIENRKIAAHNKMLHMKA